MKKVRLSRWGRGAIAALLFAVSASPVFAVAGTTIGTNVSIAGTLGVTGASSLSSLTLTSALSIADGGTGATSASAARTALGLAIGSDVQAYSANLASWSALAPSAKANSGANSDITSLSGLTTALSIAQGGTGATTASAARTALGLAIGSDVQAYDADLTSWSALAPSAKANSGANSDITSLSGLTTALSVAQGGTGATTASAARTALGLAIGSDVQAYDADLTSWSALAPSAKANSGANSDITSLSGLTTSLSVAQGGTGATTASAARTALGLAIGSDVQAFDADLSTYAGITPSANVQTLLGAADFAAFRTSLGLGSLATLSSVNNGNWSGTALAVANGGTGATTANAAFNALAPSQATFSGRFLTTNGTDTSWAVIAGGGDALVANPLSQFASTTSAQLAGVMSDETGSGALVFATSPTLVTPALGTPSAAVLTNATGLPLTTGVTGNLPVGNLNSGTSASATTFWRGDGTWATPSGGGTSMAILMGNSGGNINAGATQYFSVVGRNNTESLTSVPLPYSCTAKKLYVKLDGDIGAVGGTINTTITLRKNEATPSGQMTCTITGSAGTDTTCSDLVNTTSFAAGDTWDVLVVVGAGATNRGYTAVFECDSP